MCRQADVFVTVAGVSHIGDKLLPVSLLPAISYRRCRVTGEKLIAGAMKLMKSGTKLNHWCQKHGRIFIAGNNDTGDNLSLLSLKD
jgi:hypothetical protein